VKISPKRSPKSILEEGQTNRECHVKPAVPNSKGRACHAKKIGEKDREVARPAVPQGMAVPPVQKWHGRATAVLQRPDFKRRDFVLVSRGEFSFS